MTFSRRVYDRNLLFTVFAEFRELAYRVDIDQIFVSAVVVR